LQRNLEERALHIVEDHAAIVRSLFRRYLEAGSVVRLIQQLDAEEVRIPIRIDGGGRSTGGGLFSRGHIYKILSNPIYVGRIAHKGQVHEGQHKPIVIQDLWDRVQQNLCDHLGAARTKRTRQIIQGSGNAEMNVRPMRAYARAILIEALRDAHRWLDELLSDPRLTLESIASREDKSERSIRMTLSLAFLAPEIVKAAVEGRLPRGFGLKRLVDLPIAWPDQWLALGLQAPTTYA
jgi:hypothetical protein